MCLDENIYAYDAMPATATIYIAVFLFHLAFVGHQPPEGDHTHLGYRTIGLLP
jgi:hypothetical protein